MFSPTILKKWQILNDDLWNVMVVIIHTQVLSGLIIAEVFWLQITVRLVSLGLDCTLLRVDEDLVHGHAALYATHGHLPHPFIIYFPTLLGRSPNYISHNPFLSPSSLKPAVEKHFWDFKKMEVKEEPLFFRLLAVVLFGFWVSFWESPTLGLQVAGLITLQSFFYFFIFKVLFF